MPAPASSSGPSPGTPAKVCAICGADCAGKPRVKDPSGTYFCKPCHDKVLAQGEARTPPRRAPAPAASAAAYGVDDADELASIRRAAAPEMKIETCPGCRTPMEIGAVVCTHCGYNRSTGKKAKIKVSKEGEGLDKEKIKVALWYANPLAWLGAAAAGAVVSAGLWGIVASSLGWESSLFALGVGTLCGGCVVFVAKGYASWLTGLMAAAAAIAGILGGMYWARYLVADQAVGKFVATITIDDEAGQRFLAVDTTLEMTARGETLLWPANVNPDPEAVESLEELPPEALAAATKKWTDADQNWRDHYKEQKLKMLRERISSSAAQEDLFSGPDSGGSAGGGYRTARGWAWGWFYKIVGVAIAFSLGAGAGFPGRG